MRFTKLCVSLLVAGLAAFAVGCGETKLTEAQYIEKAKQALDSGADRAAVIQLKNALQLQPNSPEGRFLLGDLYVRAGDGAAAESELKKASEHGVAAEAITLLLGDAMLMQGKSDAAISLMQANDKDSSLVKSQKSIVLGEAYFQLKEYEKSRLTLAAVAEPDAMVNRAKLGLARIMLVERKQDSAAELIQQVLARENDNVRGWVTLADVYRSQRNSEKTVEAYRKAVQVSKSPQDYFSVVAMRGIVSEFLVIGKTKEAEAELNTLKKSFHNGQFPNEPATNHLRSVLALQKQEYDVANDLAEKVLKVDAKNLGAILVLGATNAAKGRYEQAQDYLSRYLAAVPGHIAATKLLALVQVSRNQAGQAVKTLSPIVRAAPDAEVLAMIASASLRAGDAKSSVDYYQRALGEKPEASQLRAGLAQGLSGLGQFDKAIDELEKFKAANPGDKAADFAIVETYVKAKKYVEAIRKLTDMTKAQPADPQPAGLLGSVYMEMNQPEQAKAAFEQALRIKPGYPPAARSLAMLYLQKKDADSADKVLAHAIEQNPKHLGLLHDYTRMALGRKDLGKAERTTRIAQGLDKSNGETAVLMAQTYLQQQKPSQALAELRGLGDAAARHPAVLAEMGNAQMMLGEYPNAASTFETLVVVSDTELTNYLLYTARAASGDKPKAKQALTAALKHNEKFVPAMVASVTTALGDKDVAKAKDAIQRLDKAAPSDLGTPLLKAELALLEKNPRQAIAIYEGLPPKSRDSAETVKRLSQSYWMAGDKAKSVAILDAAIAKQPNDSNLQYTLASAYESLGDKPKAIAMYQQIVKLNDHHVLALNNLAWLLKDSDLAAATGYAEKAAELAPKNDAINDTLKTIRMMGKK